MIDKHVNVRNMLKSLRSVARTELEKMCIESGMSDREIDGTVAFVYDRKSVPEVAKMLNMSESKFQVRKQVLADRLYNYIVSSNIKLIDADKIFDPPNSNNQKKNSETIAN